jgi:hypothetical protein
MVSAAASGRVLVSINALQAFQTGLSLLKNCTKSFVSSSLSSNLAMRRQGKESHPEYFAKFAAGKCIEDKPWQARYSASSLEKSATCSHGISSLE